MPRRKLKLSKERRQLVNELFVVATVLAEKAQDLAFKGHSPKVKPQRYAHYAHGLQKFADQLSLIAGAITATIESRD